MIRQLQQQQLHYYYTSVTWLSMSSAMLLYITNTTMTTTTNTTMITTNTTTSATATTTTTTTSLPPAPLLVVEKTLACWQDLIVGPCPVQHCRHHCYYQGDTPHEWLHSALTRLHPVPSTTFPSLPPQPCIWQITTTNSTITIMTTTTTTGWTQSSRKNSLSFSDFCKARN